MKTRNNDLARCRWFGAVALAAYFSVVTLVQAQQSTTIPARVFGYGTLRLMGMSSDAKRFATAGSRGIFVWDADTGDLIRSFEKDFVPGDWPHRDDTSSIAIAPNGETLAAARYDGTSLVWDIPSGDELLRSEAGSVAFSPDGSRIITSGGGRTMIWNLTTGQKELDVPIRSGGSLAFSPDGARFAGTASLENLPGAVGVWSSVTGEQQFSLNGHAQGVQAVAFSPDGSRIATGTGGFNQATSQNEGSVRIWNAVDGELIAPISLSDRVWSLAFSPDSKTLIAGAGEYYDPGRSDGGKVFVWDADAGTGMRTLTLHQSAIHSIALVQDGTGFWTASDDRTVRQTRLDGQALKVFDQHVANYSFWNVAFSPDGLKACTGLSSPAVWECATGRILFRLDTPRARSAAFSPDGSKLLTAAEEDPIARLWNAQDGTFIRGFEAHSGGVWAVAWSPDGTRIMTGGGDETARVWDVETGETVRSLTHPGRVVSLSFSQNGRQALTGDFGDWQGLDWRSETRLWNLDSGELLRTLEGGHKCEFSNDGTKIRTTDGRGNLKVFDASNGNLVQNLEIGWSEFAFSTDEKFFVTFSTGPTDAGHMVNLREADTGRLLRTLDAGEWVRAAFWPGGDHVLTGSWDGVARLWSIEDLTNAQIVHIPDPGLLAAIRSALNKPTGDITVSDMETLTVLDASWTEGSIAAGIQSIAGLAAAKNLTSLDLSGNQLTSLTLPNDLSRLTRLDVTGNPLVYLGVPESLRDRLELLGFPVDLVVYIPELRIGPAIVLSDGRVLLQLSGANGQCVRVQRSANLIDWEDWRTVTLDGTGCELIDETAAASHRFYRAVEDNSGAGG